MREPERGQEAQRAQDLQLTRSVVRRAETHHASAGAEQRHAAARRGAADLVEDHVESRLAAQAADGVGEVGMAVVDRVIDAELA